MKKIKVEFHRFDNFVFGRVVSMPENLRGEGEIISYGGYCISSNDYPALYETRLVLRGHCKYKDNYYFGCNYGTLVGAQLAISNFENLIRKWNTEHQEILDDVEKEYLSAVIKPFKNRIKNIKKTRQTGENFEYISLRVKSIKGTYEELMPFPFFEAGKMYKGMETGKAYTLKELGLE